MAKKNLFGLIKEHFLKIVLASLFAFVGAFLHDYKTLRDKGKAFKKARVNLIAKAEIPTLDTLYNCIKEDIIKKTPHYSFYPDSAEMIIHRCINRSIIESKRAYYNAGMTQSEIDKLEEITASIYSLDGDSLFLKVEAGFFKIYNNFMNGLRVEKLSIYLDSCKFDHKRRTWERLESDLFND